jgi:hypothetical protein
MCLETASIAFNTDSNGTDKGKAEVVPVLN